MIFKPEMVRAILADEKTQTRRGTKKGEGLYVYGLVSAPGPHYVSAGGPIKWMEGRTYAIQPGRGKPAVARFLLEQIRYCERAGAISEEDAHWEGFDSAADFCTYYAHLNGTAALDNPCWALSFHLIEEEECDA